MLREEQIEARRQRAREAGFKIENVGRKRVWSTYRVSNPATGGSYTVAVGGPDDPCANRCSCPDFRSNTLCTCKHIEAVLEHLKENTPPHLLQRKPVHTRPEVYLRYGERLELALRRPPRHSDALAEFADRFFDGRGVWKPGGRVDELITAAGAVPEEVFILPDAMDFIDWENERREMAAREAALLQQLERGELDLSPLTVPLYEYQMRGALFAAYRGRSILGDDMGLGKTVQTLAAVELLASERGIRNVLVVAPASVKYQWEAEVRRFTGRSVQVIEGPPPERRRLYEAETFYRLVNYEQVVRDRDPINATRPDMIVLDEAQRIKNWESKTSKAVKKLRSRYALVLTGTPLENRLEELYSIVQFVDDRALGPAFEFLHEHRTVNEAGQVIGYKNLDQIRERLKPIFLRRTREEVLSQLPPRTDTTVYVELSEPQLRLYEEQRLTLVRLLRKSRQTDLDRKRILACLVNMRLICDSAYLFDKATEASPKLDEFEELIPELTGENSKVIVFSQWESMLTLAAKVLDRLNVGHTLLHGKLSGGERREALGRFRQDENCRVFLSTDAGGTGLNLQAADTVMNLEVPWNPAVLDQRVARAHRMGQTRPVRVINFVTRDSVEEKVLRALEAKRGLFAGVFDGETDEVPFEAVGRASFLDGVRELVGEAAPEPPAAAATPKPADPQAAFWDAGVAMLEALAAIAEGPGVPESAAGRARAALQRIADALAP